MDYTSARTNMVESQVRTADVTDFELQEAMRRIERERFLAPARAFAAYADAEPEICPGRYLMRPREVAKLLMGLKPRHGETALCIAAPYAAAVLADMGLKVTALEGDARAAAIVEPALAHYGVTQTSGDLAAPQGSGFDVIVSEGAVGEIPAAWIAALRPGGRMGVVVRDGPVGKARLFVRGAQIRDIGGASSRELFDATPPVLAGFARQTTFQF
jgi:protein-L-isoaspartate(D-aspartate) O-methyltransferase